MSDSATFKGRPFWSGAFDPIDGQILEVHPYKRAQDAGFHHSMYFSDGAVDAMKNNKAHFFWVDDGKINTEWREASAKPHIIGAIASQIKTKHKSSGGPADADKAIRRALMIARQRADGGKVNPLDALGYRQDNPARRGNTEWLENKQRNAEASNDPSMLRGAVTGFFNHEVNIPVDMLEGVPGANKENPVPGTYKYDELMKDVRKKGWKPDPILVGVNHKGKAYILEGNHRAAVARAVGQTHIPGDIRWWNGGEEVKGPWHPKSVASRLLPYKRADGGPANDAMQHALMVARESRIKALANDIHKKYGKAQGERVIRAADQTNLERFTDPALHKLFTTGLVGIDKPSKFSALASELPEEEIRDHLPYSNWLGVPNWQEVTQKYGRDRKGYVNYLKDQGPLKDVPMLGIAGPSNLPERGVTAAMKKDRKFIMPQVISHDGRHRAMALGSEPTMPISIYAEDPAVMNLPMSRRIPKLLTLGRAHYDTTEWRRQGQGRDPTEYVKPPEEMFADGGSIPPFKLSSGAAKVIATKGQAKATPQQYAALPGIKPDEIKYGNLEALGTKALPREEVIKHLEANAVPLQETVYAGDDERSALKRYSGHAALALPGGQNYREVLLHLPAKEQQAYAIRYKDGPQMGSAFGSEEEARFALQEMFPGRDDLEVVPEQATSDNVRTGRALSKENFKSGHWKVPNVLAHIRMSDRKGPNDEKVLHVEELQSDWGQQGREKGFKHKALTPEEKQEHDKLLPRRMVDDGFYEEPAGHVPLSAEESARLDELIDKDAESWTGIPFGPYVDTTQKWTDLALKRVLHEAAHGGYDKVVFTPGDEQNKRYKLSKHVDELHYDPTSEYLIYKPKGEGHYDSIRMQPDKLPEAVGKELAKKLLAAAPAKHEPSGSPFPVHSLADKDLELGGSGMRGYYDNIMPKRLQALAQQHDPKAQVKLGAGRIKTHGEWPFPIKVASDGTNYWLSGRSPHNEEGEGRLSENFPSYVAADDERERMYSGYTQPVHSLDVTPQMRESIKAKGFSQFKRGGEVGPRRVAHPLVSYALRLTASKR